MIRAMCSAMGKKCLWHFPFRSQERLYNPQNTHSEAKSESKQKTSKKGLYPSRTIF